MKNEILRLKKKVADQVENCNVLFFVLGKHMWGCVPLLLRLRKLFPKLNKWDKINLIWSMTFDDKIDCLHPALVGASLWPSGIY